MRFCIITLYVKLISFINQELLHNKDLLGPSTSTLGSSKIYSAEHWRVCRHNGHHKAAAGSSASLISFGLHKPLFFSHSRVKLATDMFCSVITAHWTVPATRSVSQRLCSIVITFKVGVETATFTQQLQAASRCAWAGLWSKVPALWSPAKTQKLCSLLIIIAIETLSREWRARYVQDKFCLAKAVIQPEAAYWQLAA